MNTILILFVVLLKLVSSQICEVCQNLVKEFHNGIKASDKGNFGGGNTAWEEQRLGNFATSETRLIHILDGLCPSTASNVDKCHYLREEHEDVIEKWWFETYRKENSAESLYSYLCVDHIGACCLDKHYGKTCERCRYYDELNGLMCSGHGQCLGNGTREGNGTCVCDQGYSGESCQLCDNDYYNVNDSTCERCHHSCKGCTGANSSLCVACSAGYQMLETGCEDIDECSAPDNELCRDEGQACVNTEGSYTCECADNYKKADNGTCMAIAESSKNYFSEYNFFEGGLTTWLVCVAVLLLGIVTRVLDRISVLIIVLTLVSGYYLTHNTNKLQLLFAKFFDQ